MSRLLLLALALGFAPRLAAEDPSARIVKGETAYDLTAGTELVGRYQFAGTVREEKGDGTKPLAKPFVWPLNAPGGVPVTRAWPLDRTDAKETTDHVHQKSVWFCHGDVIPEGVDLATKSPDKGVKGVDFWSEHAGHGRIVCTEAGEPKAVAAGHAMFTTANEWRTADGRKILDEARAVHLVALPAGRLIVFDIDLHATVCPVTFGDTKEGSMGVRVSDAIRTAAKGGGTVTSCTGAAAEAPAKDNLPLWGEVANWHDYSGTIGGKPAGVAVFADPANAVPSAWHTRAYGLMAANPFGRAGSGFPSQKGKTELVRLAKGEHLKLRFGVYAHAGDVTAGKVAEAFAAFRGVK